MIPGAAPPQLSGLAGPLDYSAAAAYFETAGQGVNDRFLNRTLSGNFGLQLAEQNSLRLTVRDNTSDAGEPGQTLFTPPNLDAHNGLHNLMAGLTWDFATGPHWQHQVLASETDVHQLFQNLLSDLFSFARSFRRMRFCAVAASGRRRRIATFPTTRKISTTARSWKRNRPTPPASSPSVPATNMKSKMRFLPILDGLHARRNNQAGFLEGRWQATAGWF